MTAAGQGKERPIDRIAENPFFVLGARPDATRVELEREAQKLLGMLELGFPEAKTYATPLGPRARTAELVRAAIATLRDPYQRLVAELWARHAPPHLTAATAPDPAAPPTDRRALAMRLRRALGWRP
ncbi:MAG: hypothetical protein NT062_24890 [Proteobacteria bacterium]|nr:hypothetical protein [Pseudomonadota bacterium]